MVMRQRARRFSTTFHSKNKQHGRKTMFINTHHEEKQSYPQTIIGWVAWISCSQPDAWCHQIANTTKVQILVLQIQNCKYQSLLMLTSFFVISLFLNTLLAVQSSEYLWSLSAAEQEIALIKSSLTATKQLVFLFCPRKLQV